jgi:hypothetical protein
VAILAVVDHQPRVALEKLLISLLAEADVRRIVRHLPGGEDMHTELPGPGASLRDLVHEAVSVLGRHGRLDGRFFEALVTERPARGDEIRALAARMPGQAAARPPDEWLVGLPVPTHDRLRSETRSPEEKLRGSAQGSVAPGSGPWGFPSRPGGCLASRSAAFPAGAGSHAMLRSSGPWVRGEPEKLLIFPYRGGRAELAIQVMPRHPRGRWYDLFAPADGGRSRNFAPHLRFSISRQVY